MKNKKGFTLSEVMVAIGVLGVLAAMLVPAIMNNAPDSNKIMFKKAYFSLESTVNDLINDDTNYPEDGTGTPCVDTSGVTVNCGFNTLTLAGTSVPAGNNKFCYLLSDKMNTITSDCTTAIGTFTTTDGIYWQVRHSAQEFPVDNTLYNTQITIDVNGAKSPNCSVVAFSNPATSACAAGKAPDTFKVAIRYDGKIMVSASDTAAIAILQNPTNNQKN